MAKKKTAKKSPSKKIKESSVVTLTEKYTTQMFEFGLTTFGTHDPNAVFKKCSILNSDEFVFVSSSHLNPTTGI